jgi:4-hydroxybenzoate polyprenyltransferase
MRTWWAYVRASHAPPTLAVTVLMTLFAWSIGWRGWGLGLASLAVLIGQLSVGWSNDAWDASADARSGRRDKPTVREEVSTRALWCAAGTALTLSSMLSWAVAGWGAGSFHVLALLAAWAYNLRLSRTAWSWLPYAVAFGAMPLFFFVGLTGRPGPWWTVAVFAIVAVSAHLANALPDLDSDRSIGLDGAAIRLGARRAAVLCWVLLGIGTTTLIMVSLASASSPWPPAVLLLGYLGAIAFGSLSTRRNAMFVSLLLVVLLDLLALIATPAL